MNASRPVLLNLMLCDYVITDRVSQKRSLIGIFDRIRANVQFTGYIYFQITDMPQSCQIRVEVEKSPETVNEAPETICTFNKRYESAEITRLDTYDATLPFKGTFERPGLYEIKVFANGEYIGARSLICVSGAGKAGSTEQV